MRYKLNKEKLLICLVKSGMTQTELSNKANINRSHFSKVLNGKSNLTDFLAIKIANALDVDVSEIFDIKEEVR
ncbi:MULTISPECIES: helix-turn-helix transcriptional regulator [unclassified Staphylococcus]|uniref:helix-turn-helix domain-containing protein n=1 Tax=Staphylococcus TaxID=1279 RepID=UPI001AEC3228|nr:MULTISPECIES: helix-turn-helix transcriptional regulator [unclassified Staphylococcus]